MKKMSVNYICRNCGSTSIHKYELIEEGFEKINNEYIDAWNKYFEEDKNKINELER